MGRPDGKEAPVFHLAFLRARHQMTTRSYLCSMSAKVAAQQSYAFPGGW